MAATARQIVTRALRRIRVIGEGETPSAEMASDALEVLNTMMHGWNSDGILYAHADLTLDSNVALPDEQLGFCRDLLSAELAEEYGQALGPMMQRAVMNARNAMQAAYFIPVIAPVDAAISHRAIMTGRFASPDPADAIAVGDTDYIAVE